MRTVGTSPIVKLSKRAPMMGRYSTVGMALQAFSGAILGYLALDAGTLLLLPLGTALCGEIIFISSLGHGGMSSSGEQTL